MNKKIGIMGGAFNPFHIGHLRHAIEIKEELNLDAIDLIPSYNHPHKKGLLPYDLRLSCIQKSIEDVDFIRINTIEEKITGKSYTDIVLQKWKEENPSHTPYFMLGIEDFAVLPTWHNGLMLPSISPLIVVSRHSQTAENFLSIAKSYWENCTIKVADPKYTLTKQKKATLYVNNQEYCIFIHIPTLDITATQIRHAFMQQKNIQGLVDKNVIQFLQQNYAIIAKYW